MSVFFCGKIINFAAENFSSGGKRHENKAICMLHATNEWHRGNGKNEDSETGFVARRHPRCGVVQ